MRLRIAITTLLLALCIPAVASAGTWRTVNLPRHTSLSGISCMETNWCEAVGGWQNKLEVAHWNGRSWSVTTKLPNRRWSSLSAITCRSSRSCVAVGDLALGRFKPVDPLIERWDGRRWHIESAPKPHPRRGYRAVNTRLYGVVCPGRNLCFAVGQGVPFGAGNAPGVPLIERWDGRRWHLMSGARGAQSPLYSISCTSARACTAVGGYENEVGTPEANNQQIEYSSTVERWDGHRWTLGTLTVPSGASGDGLLGVACSERSVCLGVGSEFEPGPDYAPGNDGGTDQAIAAWPASNGTAFSASSLAFPADAYRGPASGNPKTKLGAVSCAPTNPDFCAAVGTYSATNGAIGPLAAIWNGSTWTQVALRRGPVFLGSVSCPALGWCMAVGSTIAERWS